MSGARLVRALAALIVVLAAGVLVRTGGAAQSAAGDAKRGAALFHADGCYECHGYQGEGTGTERPQGLTGPKLAPSPLPYAAFIKQLRTPRNVMPSYSANILSDADAADVYAYLRSIPAGPPLATIKLLQSVNTNGK